MAYIGALTTHGYYNLIPVLIAIRKIKERFGIDVELVVAGPIYDRGAKRIIEEFKDELHYK